MKSQTSGFDTPQIENKNRSKKIQNIFEQYMAKSSAL